MINVRPAISLDAGSMAVLLNRIIEIGGTTAKTSPVTAQDLSDWMRNDDKRTAWHVAVDKEERVVGFQWIAPHPNLPPVAADIATFVEVGQTGLGIGSALFEATKNAAKTLGFQWINATIRADNEGGLIYYQSRGFLPYGRLEDVALANGQKVDKVLKRFEL